MLCKFLVFASPPPSPSPPPPPHSLGDGNGHIVYVGRLYPISYWWCRAVMAIRIIQGRKALDMK